MDTAYRPTLDQFEGCLLGLALGDAMGAPREGGPLERLLWAIIGKTSSGETRWTDDTQMSIDVAESLLARGGFDGDDLARRFANGYRWSRGYGPGTAKLLKRLAKGEDWRHASCSVYPEGSFGNGGAMRSPVVALFHVGDPAAMAQAARQVAAVTHAHALGVEGALLIAAATARALLGPEPSLWLEDCRSRTAQAPMRQRLDIALQWMQQGALPGPGEVSRRLGNGVAAVESCVTAIYLAGRFLNEPFSDLLSFIADCGGDVDTIGSMAGALWGATRGRSNLPADGLDRLEQLDRLLTLAAALHARAP
ncbi:ADP-ribosylglycohydrolase family protein [Roseateles sp. NT4]|uniref:ADP-ribosylglycohydrolase family protein n=1 Tax=Roseateles sp. NT4 TaxID=3453715 RepID=UPI003EE9A2E7